MSNNKKNAKRNNLPRRLLSHSSRPKTWAACYELIQVKRIGIPGTPTHRCFTGTNSDERYGLRSIGNPTVIILTKAEWDELGILFEKAWSAIKRAAHLTTVDCLA